MDSVGYCLYDIGLEARAYRGWADKQAFEQAVVDRGEIQLYRKDCKKRFCPFQLSNQYSEVQVVPTAY